MAGRRKNKARNQRTQSDGTARWFTLKLKRERARDKIRKKSRARNRKK